MKESIKKTGEFSFGNVGKYGGKFNFKSQKFTPFHMKPLEIDIKD